MANLTEDLWPDGGVAHRTPETPHTWEHGRRVCGATMCLAVLMMTLSAQTPAAAQAPAVYSALAWFDCAPWDGPAFTVAVAPHGEKTVDTEHPWLQIAIWHPAESRQGVTYRFPDTDGRTGAVTFGGTAYPSARGSVTFGRASSKDVVNGTFDLVVPSGRHLTGRFQGGWIPRSVMCGFAP